MEIEIRGACRIKEKRREEKEEKRREGRDLPFFLRSWQQVPDGLPPLFFRRVKTRGKERRKVAISSRVVEIIDT